MCLLIMMLLVKVEIIGGLDINNINFETEKKNSIETKLKK